MSVKSDIVSKIQAINTSQVVTVNDITDTMISNGWKNVCIALQSETSSITDRTTSGSWSSADEVTYGLNHFRPSIRNLIKNGKAVIPYKSTKPGYQKVMIATFDKIYKFPTTNLAYFASAQNAIKNFGAAEYFTANNQGTNSTTATTQGNSAVQNYNYTQ
jgi:hypothetical protein